MNCICGFEGDEDQVRQHIFHERRGHGFPMQHTDRRREDIIQKIMEAAAMDAELSEKTDAELADLMLSSSLWGQEETCGIRSVLLSQAMERLQRANGGRLEREQPEAARA